LSNNKNDNNQYDYGIGIIDGAYGPTTIYLAGDYSRQSILRKSVSLIIIISTLILIVFDIIGYIKKINYSKKYKIKIIFSINIFLIFLLSIYIGFQILGLFWIKISTLMNIIFCILFYVNFILLKIIRKNRIKENEK